MKQGRAERSAAHAGSWYTSDSEELKNQMEGWLATACRVANKPVRGVLAPHAGFSYSGSTAAFAYSHMNLSAINRIFILGPSHHVYLRGCAVTSCSKYLTPLGSLTVDSFTTSELLSTVAC
jgi:AmmeMemoRadiSam system protein B